MIRFVNLTKSFKNGGVTRHIVRNLSLTLENGRNVGILGRNGSGKSTLVSLIAGIMQPDSGWVERHGRVSWPLGFAGSFHREVTGYQNARFVARIYGVDSDELLEFVTEFSELGDQLHLPVRLYSSGMRARLAFSLSMGIKFDTYLVDEITAVGDAAFKLKCRIALTEQLDGANVVMVSHSVKTLREYCDSGLLLEKGTAYYFDSIEDAIALHMRNMELA